MKTPSMENWKEYIEYKFQPKADFLFETIEDSTTVKIIHPLSGHFFLFCWISDDGLIFSDLQFYNNRTKGWSGEFGDSQFSPEAIQEVEDFLKPAFETGWKSKDISIFGQHFKSIVTFSQRRGDKFYTYSGYGCGCLSIFLWPLFELWGLVFGKVIKVPPISSYYTNH